jgi:hypothetical protein
MGLICKIIWIFNATVMLFNTVVLFNTEGCLILACISTVVTVCILAITFNIFAHLD